MNTEKTISPDLIQARILVVDDHPGVATTLARNISQLGRSLEVIPATSGTEALERIGNNAVDMVITDMMMPDMNGLELIEKLRAHPASRPAYTILITAYDVPGLRESARRLKVNETIIKPFRPERIRQIVGKALESMEQSKHTQKAVDEHQSFKILIADDVPDNIALLSRFMQNEGYGFISARNGIETLEKTRSEMPDLILLDVNMPEKDGFEVLREIRSDPAIEHIPVIILTAARQSPTDMQSGLNLGADDYVTKPFDRRELFARIRTKLRAKETEDNLRRRHKELSVLPEIAKDLSARLDIHELTEIVLRRSVETLGALAGHIIITGSPNPLHKEFRISTSVTTANKTALPPLDDILAQIKEDHQGIIIKNTRADPRWWTEPNDPTSSVIIAPMFGRLDLIGLLVLIHEKTNYFNSDHQLMLQAIASQAAIAIENAQLHASLAQEKQLLSTVLQSAADAILAFDATGCLTLLNPAGEKLFTGHETKLGLPLARGCGYDALIALMEETRTARKPITGEIVWPDQRTFAAFVAPIEEGGCVALLHDISHFKALERIRNEYISAVSHDLKDPITLIMLSSQIISKAGPFNDKQLEIANHIRSTAENMNELVQSLLELAKVDAGMDLKSEAVDMNALAAMVAIEYRPQAKAKQQKFLLKKAGGEPKVQGNPLQLQRALRNLVGNAIKYTPAHGSIRLSVDIRGDQLAVSVKDTGPGIPPDDLPLIFNRFYQARNNGMKDVGCGGLGLAIVKSIVDRHGGTISVQSELGKGSCFTISLPLMQSELSAKGNSINNSYSLHTGKEKYHEQ